jgi:hypothetical protein
MNRWLDKYFGKLCTICGHSFGSHGSAIPFHCPKGNCSLGGYRRTYFRFRNFRKELAKESR